MAKAFSIREAQVKDIPVIMELIYLKAEFDGCRESVTATASKLEETLFGDRPLAFVLLAESEKASIGLATYHRIYSTYLAQPGIWIDDLFVKAEYRSRGVGEALINRLCEIAGEMGCGRIDWLVAAGNTRGIQFYERMGAKIIERSRLCRLDAEAIARRR